MEEFLERNRFSDAGNQHGNKRKEAHQPLTTRMRDAEIHNLSERRRRDKINEKMKTLQELIPRCNKSNKASMLDDAIEYTKSLQLQAEMMSSMQYNMNPLTPPNAQRYFPTMGFMGMGMGMNMGMASGVEVGAATLQQPGMPLGLVLPYASIVGHAQSHLHSPLMPAFPLANMAYANQVRAQASNLLDPASNPANIRASNMVQIPNAATKHHRHVGTNHPQESAQNRPMGEPGQQKNQYYSEATGG